MSEEEKQFIPKIFDLFFTALEPASYRKTAPTPVPVHCRKTD